jgi:hypothetical protein
MKISIVSAVAAASLSFAAAAFSADQSQPAPTLDVKQLPAPVQSTLDREGARVAKVQEETENGAKLYEATVSKDGKNYSLHIDSNGQIMKREAIEK